MTTNEQIKADLRALGLLGAERDLTPEESLFDRGVMDSLGMLSLVSYLESQYAISVREEDLLPDNFDTLEAIARYVNQRRKQCA